MRLLEPLHARVCPPCQRPRRLTCPPACPGLCLPPLVHPATQVFILAGTTFLTLRQLGLAAANLTTAELLLRRKLGYLQAAAGVFSNPFDEGPLANCATVGGARRGAGCACGVHAVRGARA